MYTKIQELTSALETTKRKRQKLEDDQKIYKRRLENNGQSVEIIDSSELETLKLQNQDYRIALLCSLCKVYFLYIIRIIEKMVLLLNVVICFVMNV